MKVGLITDQHIGVRNDSLVFAAYQKKFYDEIFFPYLEKNKIKTIIDMGDTFDRRKFLNTHILKLGKEMWFDRIENEGYKLHCIIGNHSTYYRSSNHVNNISTNFSHYKNIEIYPEVQDIKIDGKLISFVPWVNPSNHDSTIEHLKNSKAKIALGHLELEGFAMYRGSPKLGGFGVDHFDDYDLVCSGHFHHKSKRKHIHYLGSPYEMTWSDYNDKRGFHILDTDTCELEFIKNPYSMFYKIMYKDEGNDIAYVNKMDVSHLDGKYVKVVVQEKTDNYMFDKFMDKVYNSNPEKVTIVEDHRNLDKQDDTDIGKLEDTLTILSSHVKRAEYKHIDKTKLQGLLSSLYNEAQNMVIE